MIACLKSGSVRNFKLTFQFLLPPFVKLIPLQIIMNFLHRKDFLDGALLIVHTLIVSSIQHWHIVLSTICIFLLQSSLCRRFLLGNSVVYLPAGFQGPKLGLYLLLLPPSSLLLPPSLLHSAFLHICPFSPKHLEISSHQGLNWHPPTPFPQRERGNLHPTAQKNAPLELVLCQFPEIQ